MLTALLASLTVAGITSGALGYLVYLWRDTTTSLRIAIEDRYHAERNQMQLENDLADSRESERQYRRRITELEQELANAYTKIRTKVASVVATGQPASIAASLSELLASPLHDFNTGTHGSDPDAATTTATPTVPLAPLAQAAEDLARSLDDTRPLKK